MPRTKQALLIINGAVRWLLCMVVPGLGNVPVVAAAPEIHGALAITSEPIFRGLSLSDRQPALQADVHLQAATTTAGVWLSRSKHVNGYYASFEADGYVDQALPLSTSWVLHAGYTRYTYPQGRQFFNYDYDEWRVAANYTDRLVLSVVYSPDTAARGSYNTIRNHRWIGYQAVWRQPVWTGTNSVWSLTGSVGAYQWLGLKDGDYLAWSAGAAWRPGSFDLSVSYVDVDSRTKRLYGTYAADGRVIVSAGWRF